MSGERTDEDADATDLLEVDLWTRIADLTAVLADFAWAAERTFLADLLMLASLQARREKPHEPSGRACPPIPRAIAVAAASFSRSGPLSSRSPSSRRSTPS